MVVDQRVAISVVACGQTCFTDCHADCVRQPLPEWSGGDFNTRRMPALGMSRCLAAPLAEMLDVVQREVIAAQVQQAVEQHRTVASRKHEAVAIKPVRIARVVFEPACP